MLAITLKDILWQVIKYDVVQCQRVYKQEPKELHIVLET